MPNIHQFREPYTCTVQAPAHHRTQHTSPAVQAVESLRLTIDRLAATRQASYVAGWRWGFVCGAVCAALAAALLVLTANQAAWPL